MTQFKIPIRIIWLGLMLANFTLACGQKGALILPSEAPTEDAQSPSSAPVTTDSSIEK